MAKIKFSALVADVRGKVGGNVFSRNASGGYVRTYVSPVNPSTIPQQFVRAIFAVLTAGWRALTSANRTAWFEATPFYPYQDKLGETKTYTAQQLYMKLNQNLRTVGLPPIDVPATPAVFPAITAQSVAVDSSSNTFILDAAFDGVATTPVGFYTIVRATAPMSAGIDAPQRSLFKQIAVLEPSYATVAVALSGEYLAVFGDVGNAGDGIYMELVLVSATTGEAASGERVKTIVVA